MSPPRLVPRRPDEETIHHSGHESLERRRLPIVGPGSPPISEPSPRRLTSSRRRWHENGQQMRRHASSGDACLLLSGATSSIRALAKQSGPLPAPRFPLSVVTSAE